MGREAVLAVTAWLTVSGALAANSFVFKDQLGAESASRLYRNAVGSVYASAAPYGAYSFQIPSISTQKAAASRVVPVKESLNLQNANGYLRDSYGNRFVEALQSMKSLPFKPFPQQYVQLQELPAHFAQPLSAAPPPSPRAPSQLVLGSPYRLPAQAAPTPITQQYSFAHPGVYANSFNNLAPAAFSYGPNFGSVIHVPVQSVASSQNTHKNQPQSYTHTVTHKPSAPVQTRPSVTIVDTQPKERYNHFVSQVSHSNGQPIQDSSHANREHPTAQHQPSSHEAVYADTHPRETYHYSNHEQKFQRLQEAPEEIYSAEESPAPARHVAAKVTTKQIVSATKETPIAAVVNGKKTVVNVKTKPPLPLLDISLLEPLTFDNPLVPQVQHFLPRINQATYHKLPELDKQNDKKYHKEFVVQKTKSYDSGIVKGKPKKPRKKQKVPEVEHIYHDEYIPAATARPTVTIQSPDEAPEISYEINSPNYKETYKEQAIKYNKETNSEPVHYTYGTNTHKEPVHYSFTHSSKEPIHIQEVRYEGKGEAPKHLVYKLKPEEHEGSDKSKTESEDFSESVEPSRDEAPHRSHHREHKEHHSSHAEAPKSNNHYVPEHREQEYHHTPSSHGEHKEQTYHHTPSSDTHLNVPHKDKHYHHTPSSHSIPHKEQQFHHTPSSDSHHNSPHNEQEYHHKPSSDSHLNVPHKDKHYHHTPSSHGVPHKEQQYHHTPSSDSHNNSPHNEQEYHHKPSSDSHHNHHQHQPQQHQSFDDTPLQHVAEYEEDIQLTAPIKVDPNQHVKHSKTEPPQQYRPPPALHHSRPSHQHNSQTDSEPQHETPSMRVHEKTKQVYIKEETPEDDDTVGDQLPKSMFGHEREEDKEQDFEKAYRNSAFGFPAYDKPSLDAEKDIFNPESYGVTHDHSVYDIDHSPFQQYQEEGNNFPKEMRLSYKDDRDKTKEDYFLDYSVNKPESALDLYKNKVGYYKLYKDQTPEKHAHEDDKNKQKQSAKLTAIPYSYYPVQGDMKKFFAQYKTAPISAAPFVFEYDYSKGTPAPTQKDNSAHSSRPFLRYKMNTHFVEPQFQYGFEPISIPQLLDSELSAMATNNSPKSEKPGTRKKIYKENFYIKKTSLSDAGANS